MLNRSYSVLLLVTMLILNTPGIQAQESIPTMSLVITHHKTTHLIFPAAIQLVNRGNPAILIERPSGFENLLELKAASAKFQESNLTVITRGGYYYSFLVSYADSPAVLNYRIDSNSMNKGTKIDPVTRPDLIYRERLMQEIMNLPSTRPLQTVDKNNLRWQLLALFTDGNILLLKWRIQNSTPFEFLPGSISYCIKDRNRNKKTATQRVQIQELETSSKPQRLPAAQSQIFVSLIAVPHFEKPKLLSTELRNEDGNQVLQMWIKPKKLLHAKRLVHK